MKEQGKLPMGLIFAGIFFLFAVLSLFFFEKYANKHVARTIRKNLKKKGNVIDSNIKVKFDGKAIKVLRGKEKSIIKTNSIIDVIKLNNNISVLKSIYSILGVYINEVVIAKNNAIIK
ncbi:MAG: hypothetical protein E7L05_05660, partial [Clostridium sp.]|nr:hypothetical protein [Clostridium sp.]